MVRDPTAVLERWVSALEVRHLSDLRFSEVTRGLRALSSAYVERRHSAAGTALEGAGKRAAFALFYAPLHFLAAWHVINALDDVNAGPAAILDVGCGTGAAGSAWAILGDCRARVTGIDRHPWAIDEARWTYRTLGVRGTARRADVRGLPRLGSGDAVIAAYVLNELADSARERLEDYLFGAATAGARVLVLEPVARRVAPWWGTTAHRAVAGGGRSDTWRFRAARPDLLKKLDKAAGLDHEEIIVRSIWLPGPV